MGNGRWEIGEEASGQWSMVGDRGQQAEGKRGKGETEANIQHPTSDIEQKPMKRKERNSSLTSLPPVKMQIRPLNTKKIGFSSLVENEVHEDFCGTAQLSVSCCLLFLFVMCFHPRDPCQPL